MQCVILVMNLDESLFEEGIAIEGEGQSEGHQTHDGESHDDRELLTEGFEMLVGHGLGIRD